MRGGMGHYARDCPTPGQVNIETGGEPVQASTLRSAGRTERLNERAKALWAANVLGHAIMVKG